MNLFGEEVQEFVFSNAKVYERHLEGLLKKENYTVDSQRNIGKKPYPVGHIVDILLNNEIIISAKLQNKIGTSEEKVPFEQLMLQIACEKYGYKKAYIVCAGNGWSKGLLDYYTSKEYNDRINLPNVTIFKHDDFLKIINKL